MRYFRAVHVAVLFVAVFANAEAKQEYEREYAAADYEAEQEPTQDPHEVMQDQQVLNATTAFIDGIFAYQKQVQKVWSVVELAGKAVNATEELLLLVEPIKANMLRLMNDSSEKLRTEHKAVYEAVVKLSNFSEKAYNDLFAKIEKDREFIQESAGLKDWDTKVRGRIVNLKPVLQAFLAADARETNRTGVKRDGLAKQCLDKQSDPILALHDAWALLVAVCQVPEMRRHKREVAQCAMEHVIEDTDFKTDDILKAVNIASDLVSLQTFSATLCIAVKGWDPKYAPKGKLTDAKEREFRDVVGRIQDFLHSQLLVISSRYFTTGGQAQRRIDQQLKGDDDATVIANVRRELDYLDATYKDWRHGIVYAKNGPNIAVVYDQDKERLPLPDCAGPDAVSIPDRWHQFTATRKDVVVLVRGPRDPFCANDTRNQALDALKAANNNLDAQALFNETSRLGCAKGGEPQSVLNEFAWKVFASDLPSRFSTLIVMFSEDKPIELTDIYFEEHGVLVDAKCGENKYLHGILIV